MSVPEKIVERLGRGGMGEVYKARDTRLYNRLVALKILSEELSSIPDARSRFQREVEVASKLKHRHIVQILEQGEFDGRPFFTMEYLEGGDLRSRIRQGQPPDLEWALEISRQVCEALEYAHSQGVVHRDIKPDNIMLATVSGPPEARLVDFGIVHVEKSNLTRTATQPGTQRYASPEWINNEPADHRSDLFSLGIVFYELYTGTHPFAASSEVQVAIQIRDKEPVPPRGLAATLPAAIDSLILKLLEKDRSHRPQSAAEVAEAIRHQLRKIQSKWASTDPAEYGSLDEITRDMIEKLVAFARQLESDGSLEKAVEAYEKALTLAPGTERITRRVQKLRHRLESDKLLHKSLSTARAALDEGKLADARDSIKSAWVLSPENEEVRELQERLERAERQTVPPTAEASFLESRQAEVEAALDDGDVDHARGRTVEVLRRHPDDPWARRMIERLIAISTSGVPYREYRAEIRDARRSLGEGDLEKTRHSLSRAQALWAGDEEVLALEREVEAKLGDLTASLVDRAEDLMRIAEEPEEEAGSALLHLGEAKKLLDQARDLTGETDRIRGRLGEIAEIEKRLRERVAREEEERERRIRRVEALLQQAREQLTDADALDARWPGGGNPVLEAYERAQTRFGRVLQEDSDNAEALAALERIEASLLRTMDRIEEERKALSQSSERLDELASRLGEASRAVEVGTAALSAVRLTVDAIRTEVASLAIPGPLAERVLALKQEMEALEQRAQEGESRQRAEEERRRKTVESALQEGRRLLLETEVLLKGKLDSVERVSKACDGIERTFRGVLEIDPSNAVALEGIESADRLRLRANEAIQARSASERQKEERQAITLLGEVRDILVDVQALRPRIDDEADAMLRLLKSAKGKLEAVGAIDPSRTEIGPLIVEIRAIEEEANPKLKEATERRRIRQFDERLRDLSRRLKDRKDRRGALPLAEQLLQEAKTSEPLAENVAKLQRWIEELRSERSRRIRTRMVWAAAPVVLALIGWLSWWGYDQLSGGNGETGEPVVTPPPEVKPDSLTEHEEEPTDGRPPQSVAGPEARETVGGSKPKPVQPDSTQAVVPTTPERPKTVEPDPIAKVTPKTTQEQRVPSQPTSPTVRPRPAEPEQAPTPPSTPRPMDDAVVPEAAPAYALVGTVQTADGRSAGAGWGVTIRVALAEGNTERSATTDPAGNFRIPVGEEAFRYTILRVVDPSGAERALISLRHVPAEGAVTTATVKVQ